VVLDNGQASGATPTVDTGKVGSMRRRVEPGPAHDAREVSSEAISDGAVSRDEGRSGDSQVVPPLGYQLRGVQTTRQSHRPTVARPSEGIDAPESASLQAGRRSSLLLTSWVSGGAPNPCLESNDDGYD
jgi:hypothetical protein